MGLIVCTTVSASSYLYEKPGCNQSQPTVLAIEAVVIGVEGKVVEIKEPAKNED